MQITAMNHITDTGYISEAYANSFSMFGEPQWLSGCGGYILERPYVPPKPQHRECYYDAMGLYPLFQCHHLQAINQDFDDLAENEIISLTLVADPFMIRDFSKKFPLETLSSSDYFPDLCSRFKDHVIVLSRGFMDNMSKHHRDRALKACKSLEVRGYVSDCLPSWYRFNEMNNQHHGVDPDSMKGFPMHMMRAQSKVPGFRAYRAILGDKVVGITTWMVQGNIAYSHTTAMGSLGRKHMAGFALYFESMRHMITDGVEAFDLGSYPSTKDGSGSGLEAYKKGWSSFTLPSYLLGKILDRSKYEELSIRKLDSVDLTKGNYFPSYRHGEML